MARRIFTRAAWGGSGDGVQTYKHLTIDQAIAARVDGYNAYIIFVHIPG